MDEKLRLFHANVKVTAFNSLEQPSPTAQHASPGSTSRKQYRPWDRNDLLNRLQSFKPSTWFAKPQPLSAVHCACKGWRNVGVNVLACDFCCGKILCELPPGSVVSDATGIQKQPQAIQAIDRYVMMLTDSHQQTCPWKSGRCDPEVISMPPADPSDVHQHYQNRLNQLLQVDNLPNLSSTAIAALQAAASKLGSSGTAALASLLGMTEDQLGQLASQQQPHEHADGSPRLKSSSSKQQQLQRTGSISAATTPLQLSAPKPVPVPISCERRAQLLAMCGWQVEQLKLPNSSAASAQCSTGSQCMVSSSSAALSCTTCGCSAGLWLYAPREAAEQSASGRAAAAAAVPASSASTTSRPSTAAAATALPSAAQAASHTNTPFSSAQVDIAAAGLGSSNTHESTQCTSPSAAAVNVGGCGTADHTAAVRSSSSSPDAHLDHRSSSQSPVVVQTLLQSIAGGDLPRSGSLAPGPFDVVDAATAGPFGSVQGGPFGSSSSSGAGLFGSSSSSSSRDAPEQPSFGSMALAGVSGGAVFGLPATQAGGGVASGSPAAAAGGVSITPVQGSLREDMAGLEALRPIKIQKLSTAASPAASAAAAAAVPASTGKGSSFTAVPATGSCSKLIEPSQQPVTAVAAIQPLLCPSEKLFDPVHEHRPWCPWVSLPQGLIQQPSTAAAAAARAAPDGQGGVGGVSKGANGSQWVAALQCGFNACLEALVPWVTGSGVGASGASVPGAGGQATGNRS